LQIIFVAIKNKKLLSRTYRVVSAKKSLLDSVMDIRTPLYAELVLYINHCDLINVFKNFVRTLVMSLRSKFVDMDLVRNGSVCAGSLSLQTVPERGPESLDPGGGCPAPRECQVSHYLPNYQLFLYSLLN
jgi:hypothetical protein